MHRSLIGMFLLVGLTACAGADTTQPAPPAGGENKPAATAPAKKAEVAHPWAKFKVGSFAKTKTTTVTTIAGRKTTMTTDIKQTLLELTADKATVEMETAVMGTTTKTKTDIPLTSTDGGVSTPAGVKPSVAPKEGTEDLTVAGKTVRCKWIETEFEQNGNKTSSKTWTSEDVPGFIVKSVSKTGGSVETEITSEVVEFEAK